MSQHDELRATYIESAKANGDRAGAAREETKIAFFLAAQQDTLTKLLQLDIAIVNVSKK